MAKGATPMLVLPLLEWRLRNYWSVRKLAQKASMSTETLHHAERGGKAWDVTARKIADALEVSVSQVADFAKYHIEDNNR